MKFLKWFREEKNCQRKAVCNLWVESRSFQLCLPRVCLTFHLPIVFHLRACTHTMPHTNIHIRRALHAMNNDHYDDLFCTLDICGSFFMSIHSFFFYFFHFTNMIVPPKSIQPSIFFFNGCFQHNFVITSLSQMFHVCIVANQQTTENSSKIHAAHAREQWIDLIFDQTIRRFMQWGRVEYLTYDVYSRKDLHAHIFIVKLHSI